MSTAAKPLGGIVTALPGQRPDWLKGGMVSTCGRCSTDPP